ncbi:hypothetical protein ACFP3Q_01040 [Nocardioides sp. GCM10027113]|uniref:hypothetical protein n=1 Tax=unclassified Nocardioides TaxID=2615069 RepID=UPI00361F2355
MRRTTATRAAAAAAALPLLLGTAACAGDPEGTTAAEAAEELPPPGEQVPVEDFVADYTEGLDEATTAQVDAELGVAGQEFEIDGEIDYTTDPTSVAFTLAGASIGERAFEARAVEGVYYVNLGPMSEDRFVRYDADSEELPSELSDLTGQLDPKGLLAEFEPAIERVVFVGTEDIQGDEFNHFAVVLDAAAVAEEQGMPATGLPETVEYDVWFDGEYQLRRLDMQVSALGITTNVRVDATAWGEPVDIAAPADDEVVDPSEVRGIG